MDDNTPVDSEITVNIDTQDDIDDVLSEIDSMYWEPKSNGLQPEITVTITEEEKPITDIIVTGDYEKFVVTIFDKDDTPVEEIVS